MRWGRGRGGERSEVPTAAQAKLLQLYQALVVLVSPGLNQANVSPRQGYYYD